ncbi:hypothetical protein HDU93_007496 [Gonapodya sp. JEL0774]|nr:hypothetical protein HDU93_007496 [Gonapodya sp. JEL0774]
MSDLVAPVAIDICELENVTFTSPTWFSVNYIVFLIVVHASIKLCGFILKRLDRKRWESFTEDLRVNVISYLVQTERPNPFPQIIFTTIVLAIQLATIRILDPNHAISLPELQLGRTAASMLTHHLCTILLSVLIMSVFGETFDLNLIRIGLTLLYQATLEQITFVGLLLYRYRPKKWLTHYVLLAGAIIPFLLKLVSLAYALALWGKYIAIMGTSNPYILATNDVLAQLQQQEEALYMSLQVMHTNRQIISEYLDVARNSVHSAHILEARRHNLELALHAAKESSRRISTRKKFIEWALPQAQTPALTALHQETLQIQMDMQLLSDIPTVLNNAQRVLLAELSLSLATNREIVERLSRENSLLASLRAHQESVIATFATLPQIIEAGRQRSEELRAELHARQEELDTLKACMELKQGEKALNETRTELALLQLQDTLTGFQARSAQHLQDFEAACASREKWQGKLVAMEQLTQRRDIMLRVQELGNEIETEATEPTWASNFDWPIRLTVSATVYSLDVDGYYSTGLRSYLLRQVERNIRVKSTPATSVQLQRMSKPFAKGLYRSAYFSTLAPSRPKTVAKLFHLQRSIEIDSEHALKVAKATVVAEVFARCFTDAIKDLSGDTRPIKAKITIGYLSTTIAIHNDNKQVYMIEDMLDGWTKWSNNAEVALDNDYGRLLSAFTHYTYQFSGERVLVTDNQGFCDESNPDHLVFRLTDPAVHTLSTDFEGLDHDLDANNGEEGRQAFLNSHKCSEWCRSLNLNPTASEAKT